MKQFLKKLKVILIILMMSFILIYTGIYLSGIWRFTLSGVRLSFESTTTLGMCWVYAAFSWRDQVDTFLSARDAEYEYVKRKQYRRSLRLILRAVWILVFGVVFALGQANHWHDAYEYLGKLDLIDLIIVFVYGIIFATIIPIPKEPTGDTDKELLEAKSLDSSML